jgi:hypothetical protein
VLRNVAAAIADGDQWEPAAPMRYVVQESYHRWSSWGDKYNENLLDVPGLLATVGPAQLILLVRHPDEIARSQLEWPGDRLWRPIAAAQHHG